MTDPAPRLVGVGARVHLFVSPRERIPFTALFRDVLGCEVVEREFGLEQPVLLVRFVDGSAFSVEFSDLAPSTEAREIDDEHALRGAWIEFRTPDLGLVQQALRTAGIPEFRHRGSEHTYFIAPGGQVFRLLDVNYIGP